MKRYGLLAAVLISLAGNATAEPRIWTSGKHKLKAEFVSLKDGVVHLRNLDGKVIPLPIAKLSPEDQKVATELAGKQAGRGAAAGDPEFARQRLAAKLEALEEQLEATENELAKLKYENEILQIDVENEKAKNTQLRRELEKLKGK